MMTRNELIQILCDEHTKEELAQTIVDALSYPGQLRAWDSETIESVLDVLMDASPAIPSMNETETWRGIFEQA